MRAQLKTAVVKTYPIPRRRFSPLDSSDHVSAKDTTQEGRQEARLLERRGEQACCWRPRGAAPRAVPGRDQLLAGWVWRKAIEVLDDDVGRPRTLALFPEDRCTGLAPDRVDCSVRLVGHAVVPAAAVGRMLAGGACGRRCSLTVSGPTGCRRAARERDGTRCCWYWLVPAAGAGQRVAVASRMVWQQRHGRSAGRRLRAGRSTSSTPATTGCSSTKTRCSLIWWGAGATCSTPISMCCSTI